MDQVIKNAEEKLEYLSSDAETIALYRAREAALHERANMISSAKDEGIEESKMKIARNMLTEGMPIPLIAKMTELTEEYIQKLRNELKTSSN